MLARVKKLTTEDSPKPPFDLEPEKIIKSIPNPHSTLCPSWSAIKNNLLSPKSREDENVWAHEEQEIWGQKV